MLPSWPPSSVTLQTRRFVPPRSKVSIVPFSFPLGRLCDYCGDGVGEEGGGDQWGALRCTPNGLGVLDGGSVYCVVIPTATAPYISVVMIVITMRLPLTPSAILLPLAPCYMRQSAAHASDCGRHFPLQILCGSSLQSSKNVVCLIGSAAPVESWRLSDADGSLHVMRLRYPVSGLCSPQFYQRGKSQKYVALSQILLLPP